jgi:hypothetical protein
MGSVHWLVAQQVQKISQWQIDQFQYIWGDSAKRSQMGNCELDDKYSGRMCMCMSTMGSIDTDSRASCSPVPRKPALQTTLDILGGASATPETLVKAIDT